MYVIYHTIAKKDDKQNTDEDKEDRSTLERSTAENWKWMRRVKARLHKWRRYAAQDNRHCVVKNLYGLAWLEKL